MRHFLLARQGQTLSSLVLLLCLLLTGTASGQLPNDVCTTALPFPAIPTDGLNCATVTGTTIGAFGGGTICGGINATRDVWYTFTVPIGYSSLVYTVVNNSATGDVGIQVLSGDCPGTSLGCFITPSGTIPGLTNATTYLLRVFNPTAPSTDFEICLKVAPPNDECANALAFPAIPADGSCATMNVNTAGATGAASATCGGREDDDVWYTFVMPMGFTRLSYASDYISGETDIWLQLFEGSCAGASEGCFDDETGTIQGLVGGQTYVVRAYTDFVGVAANFNLCLRLPPANDACTDAIPFPTLPADGSCATVTANTIGATGSGGVNCIGEEDDDVWYSFTVPAGVNFLLYTMTNLAGSSDHAFEVRAACAGGIGTCYNDESGEIINLAPGATYFLRAYTIDFGASSIFDICLQIPVPNNNCTGALPMPAIPLDGSCSTVTGIVDGPIANTPVCGSNINIRDVWHSFTMPVGYTDIAYATTFTNVSGVDGFAGIEVLSGACPGVSVNCSSNASSGRFSGLTGGTTYLLRVLARSPTLVNYEICLSLPPVNDLCANAMAFPALPADGSCATLTVNTSGASSDGNSVCGGTEDDDVWFTFTVPPGFTAVTYTNTNISGATDRRIQLFNACNGASLGCFDEELGRMTGLTGGATYWLRTYTTANNVFSVFDLCLQAVPDNDNCNSRVAFPTIPADGACATVTANTIGINGSTSSTCPGQEDDNVWYSFTVPVGYTSLVYTMTNISGSADHVFSIGTACNNASIGCFNDESGTITGLTGGDTYILRAYTFELDVSSVFDICLQLLPPANDLCTGPVAFPGIPVDGSCATVTVNNTGATGSSVSCPGTADDDLWYTFTLPAATSAVSYAITTNSGSTEHAFEVISGGCFGVSVGCFNTETGTITVPNAGGSYLMRVYTPGAGVFANFDICLFVNPLPLELGSFTGKTSGAINILAWQTLTEKNVQFHIVERSANGLDWREIGRKNGLVNSSEPVKYVLEDRAPLAKAYYRLRSVDFDGRESSSTSILLVRTSKSFSITSIFPSPATDKLTVQFNTAQEESVTLRIMDIAGRLVWTQITEASKGMNELPIALQGLQSGLYTVTMSNSTDISTPLRFVKQ